MIYIGQRYHVVLTAEPINQSEGDNYWVRTVPAHGCGDENFVNFATLQNNTGIIRYDKDNNRDPKTHASPSIKYNCSDEPPKLLQPMLNWTVPNPSGEDGKYSFLTMTTTTTTTKKDLH